MNKVTIPEETDLDEIISSLNQKKETSILREQELKFDDEVFDLLPYPLNGLGQLIKEPQKRALALLTSLTIAGSILKKFKIQYGNKEEGCQLYFFVVGNPAQGKGYAAVWMKVGVKMQQHYNRVYRQRLKEYKNELKKYEDNKEDIEPIKPLRNFLFVSADNTKPSLLQELFENQGYGLMFIPEADTLVEAIKNEHGGFSDILRVGFHGEPYSVNRKYQDEPMEIPSVNLGALITGTLNQLFKFIPSYEDGLFSRFSCYIMASDSGFKSVFEDNNYKQINAKIAEIESHFFKLGLLDECREENMQFRFTLEQQNLYAEIFSKIDGYLKSYNGDKLSANVYRLGLTFTRICALLTFLRNSRNISTLKNNNELVCENIDFTTAHRIVNKLVYHLQIVDYLYNMQNPKQIFSVPRSLMDNNNSRISKETILKALELHKNGLTYRDISEKIFNDRKHSGTIYKVIAKNNTGAFPFPETETASSVKKEINVSEALEATLVSAFANVFSPKPLGEISLMDLLKNSCQKEVYQIRNSKNAQIRKNLKLKMPAFTPSGIFKSPRNNDNLVTHSKFICIDIDGRDNIDITNFKELKKELMKIKNVAYAGLSVGGNGYFLLIPIEDPKKHTDYFYAIVEALKTLGINVDKQGSDVCRLRTVTHDPNAYFADYATTVNIVLEYKKPEPIPFAISETADDKSDQMQQIKSLVRRIQASRIDITAKYEDWFAITCGLANTFGEDGRKYFHLISSLYPRHDRKEADKMYDSCLKNYPKTDQHYTLASLFWIAKNYGVY